MTLTLNRKAIILTSVVVALGLFVSVAAASNAWGKYHWNKSTADSVASPLEIGNNLTTAAWTASLSATAADWNNSVLKNQVVAGAGNANCGPTSGRVEVCNAEYGDTQWLGIASIWVKRGRSNHITQGVVLVNDTYFNTSQYDTEAWRNVVMCQEVGHEFGLSHQDENFTNANLGTCMDYTNDPDGTLLVQLDNQQPNQHDYDQMTEIYAHLNSTDSDSGGPGNGGGNKGKKPKKADVGVDLSDPSSWGRAIQQDAQGNGSVFARDLGNGELLLTHVIWVK